MTGHDEYLSDGFGDLVPAHDHPSYVCSTLGPVGGDAICLMLQRLEVADSRGSQWSPIAAVGKPSPCREGRLTGAVANSHYRPQAVGRGRPPNTF
jgi:hypothetical protein